MQVGEKKGVVAAINVVPLIDILLVLLIIFMVITPLTPMGHRALLPEADEQRIEHMRPEPSVIVVQVSAHGLKINQDEATWESLGPRLAEIFKRRAEKVAFLRGDEELMFAEVARAVDVMRTAGVDAVGLLTPQTARGF